MSEKPELKKAQDILKRLKRRDFYKFAGEKLIEPALESKLKQFTEKDVIAFASKDSDGVDLKEDDIVLRSFKVNHAFGDKNPFEKVKFYKSK